MVSGYKCLKPLAHTVSCAFPWTVLLGASCSNFPFCEGSVDTFQGFLLFSFQHPRRHGWWPISLHFLRTLLAYSSQGIRRWGGGLETAVVWEENSFNGSNTQHKTHIPVLKCPWSLLLSRTLASARLAGSPLHCDCHNVSPSLGFLWDCP